MAQVERSRCREGVLIPPNPRSMRILGVNRHPRLRGGRGGILSASAGVTGKGQIVAQASRLHSCVFVYTIRMQARRLRYTGKFKM